MWMQTDDSAFTDQTNCMMLAAIPGIVGDGKAQAVTSNWPASQTAAAPDQRPRSSTIVITRDDGGVVGL
uniref:hypothetical protein n=1 Tax=Sphingomonas sp. PL-96 TaxID=2887201 RepID=UPI002B4BC806|nr:hypothetical protein [Sphingomonas sp. PL-96]